VTRPIIGTHRLRAWLTTPSSGPATRSEVPPEPGAPLWSAQKGDVTWSCELRFHGESVGWEAQILRDGDLVIGRAFILRDLAAGWAKNERDRLESDNPFA
jgi:hypothetical protein